MSKFNGTVTINVSAETYRSLMWREYSAILLSLYGAYFAFNIALLRDALTAFVPGDDNWVHFYSSRYPIKVMGGGKVAVLMPLNFENTQHHFE